MNGNRRGRRRRNEVRGEEENGPTNRPAEDGVNGTVQVQEQTSERIFIAELKSDAEPVTFHLVCERVDYYDSIMMNSPSEVDQETPPPFQSSENTKEPGTKQMNDSGQLTTNENDRGEDQDFVISLSVGDGRYLLDLGSPSEFIVDEKCILELFKSCRECNRQCRVLKKVTGLKLEINQSCHFCGGRWKWTNLPDDDKDYLQKVN